MLRLETGLDGGERGVTRAVHLPWGRSSAVLSQL